MRFSCSTICTLTAFAILTTAGSASAGLVPVQKYVSVDFEIPFDFFPGGELAITNFPELTGELINSTLVIEFVVDESIDFDAADLEISVSAPIFPEGGGFGAFWIITGKDLGWSGQGTFNASISSDALNGEIDPLSTWEINIGFNPGLFNELTISHEYVGQPPAPDVDLNNDGFVDGTDLLNLLNQWGPCKKCIADFNLDGLVNGSDLLQLLNGWTGNKGV